jgi:ABC-type uncharacterized transport system substrate-binding protein
MRRRQFLRLVGATGAALPFVVGKPALGQRTPKMPRIGVLWPGAPPDKWEQAFREGLKAYGYREGQNIALEYRWAEGKQERLSELAEELVRLNPDLIVTISAPAILALKRTTTSIPIVFAATSDPLRSGFVASLARPGGNLTGLSLMATDLAAKRLELIKSIVPKASRVAMLWNASDAGMAIRVKEAQLAAPALRVTLLSPELRTPADFDRAFADITRDPPDALLTFVDPFTLYPAIYEDRAFVDAGGLVSYGPSVEDNCRRAATYVDKILKGAKVGDLPVEQPTKFELIVNLKTAKELGIEIPAPLLTSADEVID